jgi:hypothetical protein
VVLQRPFGIVQMIINLIQIHSKNKDNKPVEMKVDPNRHEEAIYCHSENGPTFGSGLDIYIANNANTTLNSFSNLSYFFFKSSI